MAVDGLGRLILKGPQGGLYVVTASGKKGKPAKKKKAAASPKAAAPRKKAAASPKKKAAPPDNSFAVLKQVLGLLLKQRLGSGGVAMQRQVLALLVDQTFDSAHRAAIVAAGGIPVLVGVLDSPDKVVVTGAAQVLRNLMYGEEPAAAAAAAARAIAAAGAIPKLARQLVLVDSALSEDDLYLADALAGALGNMTSKKPPSRATIARQVGLIPKLVVLLGTRAAVSVAATVSNLAEGYPANQTALAAAGAIPPLVALLGSRMSFLLVGVSASAVAAEALANLARGHPANQAAIAAAGAIPPLLALLADTGKAAEALKHLNKAAVANAKAKLNATNNNVFYSARSSLR